MAEDEDRPVDETEDEQRVRDKQLIETLDRENELKTLAALLQQEPVRDLVWRVLTRCNIYGSVYNRNFGDMAMAEGARNIGLWLLSEILEADPEAEMQMRGKSVAIAHAKAREEREKKLRRGRRSS